MKVRMSENARAYVLKETRYLRKYSPVAAKSFSARIKEARSVLGVFNKIGFESEELPIPGMRRLIVGDYLLDYEILDTEIRVVAVRHGRQLAAEVTIDPDYDFEVEIPENSILPKR